MILMAGEGGRDTVARLSANRVRRFTLRSIVYLGETLSRIDARRHVHYTISGTLQLCRKLVLSSEWKINRRGAAIVSRKIPE